MSEPVPARSAGGAPGRDSLAALSTALRRESHNLRSHPQLLWQQLYARLRNGRILAESSPYWPRLRRQFDERRASPPAPWMNLRTDVYESGALVQTLLGHQDRVTCCRFVPGAASVVSASLDRTARIWDTASGAVTQVLGGHRGAIESLDVSPDGTRVVTASWDRTLKVWDTDTGLELATLVGHADVVTCCAFGPDGQRVLSGSKDTSCRVWDWATGRTDLVFEAHDWPIVDCAVSPDGSTAASGSGTVTGGDVVLVWDRSSGQVVSTLRGHEEHVSSIAFSRDGRRIVTAGWDGTVRTWDPGTGRELGSLTHGGIVSCAGFSGDDTMIVGGDVSGAVMIWRADSLTEIARLEGHGGAVEHCTSNEDSTRILSAADDDALKVWDVRIALEEAERGQRVGSSRAGFAAFTPLGQVVVATDRAVAVVEELAEPVATIGSPVPLGDGPIYAYAYHPDRNRLATGRRDGSLRVVAVDGAGRDRRWSGDHGWILSCAFSVDGASVAAGSRDGTLTVWDMEGGGEVACLEAHDERVTCCAFSPDGARLVSGSWDETLRVWDLAGGDERATLTGHEERVTCCAVSPDGRRVLSGSRDLTLRSWDAASGELLSTWYGHDGAVGCCCFSSDGRLAVSGGEDAALIVWDAATGEPLARFHGVGFMRSCDIDHRSRSLCATDSGGEIYVLEMIGVAAVRS